MSTFIRQIDRVLAAQYGHEAVVIGECGHYRSPSGQTVNIKPLLSSAVKGTASYPPNASVSGAYDGQHDTIIEVVNETTLSAENGLWSSGAILSS